MTNDEIRVEIGKRLDMLRHFENEQWVPHEGDVFLGKYLGPVVLSANLPDGFTFTPRSSCIASYVAHAQRTDRALLEKLLELLTDEAHLKVEWFGAAMEEVKRMHDLVKARDEVAREALERLREPKETP